ncbi:hypothetical protein IW261DRAFT_1423001 [Armillaria novae-zelandiae]|uniref:Uncharacterized protein n=1 Tax=Armillaria novae-zelandiae TaxID=153914 RepID=A0AA39NYU7_9AGAR|nr:hypothetical protein IW261DRAFT_1423001 [Armillaria novae-zelandiae]
MPSNPHLESDTFCFGLMDWVPMGWTEAEDNTRSLCKCSELPVKWVQAKCACLLHKLESVLELEQRPTFAKCARWSPQMLKITYHGLPEPLEANMESESEEMAEPATSPKALVAEEELIGKATDAGVEERSLTPPGSDAGNSGSDSPLAGQKHVALASPVPPVAMGKDAREPPLKKAKGFTRTGWPLALNQQLREGRMQPVMRANMEAMQDEGLLLAASTKCDRCKAASGRSCRIPADSDNGRPSCAECLISSHSCPSHLAPATRAAHLPMIPKVSTAHRQVVVRVPCIGEVAHEYRRIEGSQMNLHPPVGGDSTTDFAFGLVERLGLQSHPCKAAWDRIVAASEQIVAGYHALQYKLQNYGPFDEADVERLLTNCFPESALDEGHADFLGERIPSPVITDGERAALWILIGRHGGSPSWVEHLGGHDIRTTLNILNLGSRSIEVKEEEVDELIARGVLYTINSDPANVDSGLSAGGNKKFLTPGRKPSG